MNLNTWSSLQSKLNSDSALGNALSAKFQQFQNDFHLFNFRSLVQENPALAAKNVYWCHLNSHHFDWSQ